jgi:hypothetical protein
MKRQWRIWGVLGGLAWVFLPGLARAAAIYPTKADLTLDSNAVTVSLYQDASNLPSAVTLSSPSRCTTANTPFLQGSTTYKDVTDCWLPEWNSANGGKSVFVVININGAPTDTLTPKLVLPAGAPTFPVTPQPGTNPFLVVPLTTSAYPGNCTNYGTDAGSDFELSPSSKQLSSSPTVWGWELQPKDCGGMAVIQVVDAQGRSLNFILPRDGTATLPANGIPEIWENLHRGNLTNLTPTDDIDSGPLGNSPRYDGIRNFDEYRGFIVSGKQTRTDPQHKDLFVHLVKAQCVGPSFTNGTNPTSYFGGGARTYPTPSTPNATLTLPAAAASPFADGLVTITASAPVFTSANVLSEVSETTPPSGKAPGRARIVAVTNSTTVSAQLLGQFTSNSLSARNWQLSESLLPIINNMLSPDQVHLLGYAPGQTNVTTDEWVDRFTGMSSPVLPSVTDEVSDRVVNPNRVYGAAQKGVRVIECLDTSSPSVLGWTRGIDSPNAAGINSIVYTQRIVDYITQKLIGTATTLQYSTASQSLVRGTWTWAWSSPTLTPATADFILSKAFQWYTDHEVGHSLDLTPTVQGTSKVTYGNHWAPGTGDCLDQAITSTAKSGVVTFYIPSFCGNADQGSFSIQ